MHMDWGAFNIFTIMSWLCLLVFFFPIVIAKDNIRFAILSIFSLKVCLFYLPTKRQDFFFEKMQFIKEEIYLIQFFLLKRDHSMVCPNPPCQGKSLEKFC